MFSKAFCTLAKRYNNNAIKLRLGPLHTILMKNEYFERKDEVILFFSSIFFTWLVDVYCIDMSVSQISIETGCIETHHWFVRLKKVLKCSQTCVQRTPSGPGNSCLCKQLVIVRCHIKNGALKSQSLLVGDCYTELVVNLSLNAFKRNIRFASLSLKFFLSYKIGCVSKTLFWKLTKHEVSKMIPCNLIYDNKV
jgi:hypothetical protein